MARNLNASLAPFQFGVLTYLFGATVHFGPWPAIRLLGRIPSRLNFVDWDCRYNLVATQVSHDSALATIPHTGRNSLLLKGMEPAPRHVIL